jgi:hypothetical protein
MFRSYPIYPVRNMQRGGLLPVFRGGTTQPGAGLAMSTVRNRSLGYERLREDKSKKHQPPQRQPNFNTLPPGYTPFTWMHEVEHNTASGKTAKPGGARQTGSGVRKTRSRKNKKA